MTVKTLVTACALSTIALTDPALRAAPDFTASVDRIRSSSGTGVCWRSFGRPAPRPATIHPTRSFAILHAAIYDAVNAIDQTHESYAVRFSGVSRQASQAAAADAAAHDVLVALYPGLTSTLDATLQQSLTLVPDGRRQDREASASGRPLRDAILSLRSNDGANQAPHSLCVRHRTGRLPVDAPEFPEAAAVHALAERDPVRAEAGRSVSPGPLRRR